MILFPAVDVLDNRSVRLLHGKREQVTDYGSPLERALIWQECGAEYLHIVDLNGAFDDNLVNKKTLSEIVKNINIPIQLGGGIKSLDRVKYYLEEIGVQRVILGTVCVTQPSLVEKACSLYPDRIVGGIDAKDGEVLIKGWVEGGGVSPIKLTNQLKEMGVNTVVYTDISRDGAMTGINIDGCVELSKKCNVNVIASGGMASMDDVRKVSENNLYGAILGRSIYDKAIDLKSALELAKEKNA